MPTHRCFRSKTYTLRRKTAAPLRLHRSVCAPFTARSTMSAAAAASRSAVVLRQAFRLITAAPNQCPRERMSSRGPSRVATATGARASRASLKPQFDYAGPGAVRADDLRAFDKALARRRRCRQRGERDHPITDSVRDATMEPMACTALGIDDRSDLAATGSAYAARWPGCPVFRTTRFNTQSRPRGVRRNFRLPGLRRISRAGQGDFAGSGEDELDRETTGSWLLGPAACCDSGALTRRGGGCHGGASFYAGGGDGGPYHA